MPDPSARRRFFRALPYGLLALTMLWAAPLATAQEPGEDLSPLPREVWQSAGPELVPPGESGALDLDNTALLHWIVAKAYGQLEAYTAVTDAPLTFEVLDLVTLRPGQFGNHRIEGLVSLDAQPGIGVARGTQSWSDGETRGRDGLWYEAHWNAPGEGFHFDGPTRERFGAMTLAELIQEWASQDAALYSVEAVTSAQVRVALEGRERTYRGLFVWIPADDGERTWLMVLDYVTQGVEEAMKETEPPRRRGAESERIFGDRAHPGREGLDSESLQTQTPESLFDEIDTCWPDYSHERREQTASAGTGHLDGGSHRATGIFAIECRCDTSCNSSCQSVVETKVCQDTTGFSLTAYQGLTTCHEMSFPSFDHELIIVGDGQYSGARCGAVVACAMKACTFFGCGCPTSISVSVSAGSVTLNSVDGDWSQTVKMVKTCKQCNIRPEIEEEHECPLPGDGPPHETGTADRFSG